MTFHYPAPASAESGLDLHGHKASVASGRWSCTGLLVRSTLGGLISVGLNQDQISATPLLVPSGETIADLGIDVTAAAAAGKKGKLAIYASLPGELKPGELIADLGEFAIDAVAFKTIAAGFAPERDRLYWKAIWVNAACSIRHVYGSAAWMAVPPTNLMAGWGHTWTRALAYGAWPDPLAPAATTGGGGESFPLLFERSS